MAEKISPGHALEKRFNLYFGKPGSSLDRSPTGHGGKDAVKPVFSSRIALFIAKLLECVKKELAGSALASQARYGGNDIGIAAEMTERKAHFFKFIEILFNQLRLKERKLDGLRKKEILAADPMAAVLPAQVLKQ